MVPEFSLALIIRPVLWLAVVVVATVLLRGGRASGRIRIAFLIGGIVVFGFVFAQLAAVGIQPNPVASLRLVLARLLLPVAAPPGAGMAATVLPIVVLILLLVAGWVSNKSICGWVCPLGLLQSLIGRVPAPKWVPSLRPTNSVRVAAMAALVGGMIVVGIDLIGRADPFSLFSLNATSAAIVLVIALIVASVFIYRPWCRFLCPFGLVSWVVEQGSLLRPRIDRSICIDCRRCVAACPSTAMTGFYNESRLHADCFACGRCIAACPKPGAIGWRAK